MEWSLIQGLVELHSFIMLQLPYSAKFLRNKIFVDRPLTNFRWNKFRGSKISVSHAQFRCPLNTLFAHSRSNAMLGFSLHAFGWTSCRAFLVCLFELINYGSQAGDTSLTPATSAVEETYDGGPQESGSVRFETTIQCHVALDVHAILQNWNTYMYHFVSTLYHGLPGNLAESFVELNFRGGGRIREHRKNYAPRKFGAIRYTT